MGKASSSKKVARAARAGGSLRERPKLGFPLAIFAIIVIGSGLVFYARADRVDAAQAQTAPVANKDHWHAAYGIYVCDHWLTPLTDIPGKSDVNGIHTHGDGVMHVHPFTAAASGKKATIGQWADMTGMKINNDSFEVAGVKYANGFDCNGKPANVYVIRWADAFDPMSTGEVFTSGFPDIRYRNDMSAIVFAVVPEDQVANVPRPDSVGQLNNLEDVQEPTSSTGAPGAAGAGATDPGIDPSASVSTITVVPSAGGASPSVTDAPTSTPASAP